jgi:tetratricopeptide (TPR) repeat protein
MNEKNDFALVPRPSSAVEKAAPGAKRILSGMVADALALRNKQSVKRAFLVAICGRNGGLDEYLVSYLQKELTDNCAVQSNCFTDSEELLNAAGRKPFDLFFVFLNPDLPSKIGKPDVQKFIADLKAKFHRPIIIISNEYTYHRQMLSSFLEAGADAFFPMPFDLEHLGLALTACGIFSSSIEAPDQLESWFQTGANYFSGRSVPRDYSEAVKWYRKAAEQGYAQAQHNLGYCYQCGLGVKRDYKEAVKWYRKAAEQNHAGAQHELARSYDFGKGVEKDEVEALKWHRKAAEQNHAESSGVLGYAYLHGEGVEKNEAKAVKWLRQAADQLDEYAVCDLGICYQNGCGIPQDRSEAYKLFKISAKMEHDGVALLKSLVGQMNPVEIAEGERRFRKFCSENDLDWTT